MPRLEPKDAEIKVRVTHATKQRVVEIAAGEGEGESLIVRKAIAEYIARHDAKRAAASSDTNTPFLTSRLEGAPPSDNSTRVDGKQPPSSPARKRAARGSKKA